MTGQKLDVSDALSEHTGSDIGLSPPKSNNAHTGNTKYVTIFSLQNIMIATILCVSVAIVWYMYYHNANKTNENDISKTGNITHDDVAFISEHLPQKIEDKVMGEVNVMLDDHRHHVEGLVDGALQNRLEASHQPVQTEIIQKQEDDISIEEVDVITDTGDTLDTLDDTGENTDDKIIDISSTKKQPKRRTKASRRSHRTDAEEDNI